MSRSHRGMMIICVAVRQGMVTSQGVLRIDVQAAGVPNMHEVVC